MDRITRAFRRNFGFPVGSLVIAVLSVCIFFHFAGGFFFSPDFSVVQAFGLNYAKPFTFLSYTFIHLWVLHLLANLSFILVFGFLVERRLGLAEFFSLYIIGSALAGLFAQTAGLVFDHKLYIIVGASGAAFVLLGAALMIRPVQAFLAYLVHAWFIVPGVLSVNIDDLRERTERTLALQVEDISLEQQSAVDSYRRGAINQSAFAEVTHSLEIKKNQTVHEIKGINEARQVERVTQISESTHLNAVFIGAVICLMFRPELLREWVARARALIYHL